MYHACIAYIGKSRELWLQKALQEYEKRLTGRMRISWQECKTDQHLEKFCLKEKNVFILDSKGEQKDSLTFSKWLIQCLDHNGGRITFAIGGPTGLPKTLLHLPAISISKMTLTHQMVRLVFVEQLYRSLEIQKGSSYHK